MSLNANPDPQLRHFHAQILEKKKNQLETILIYSCNFTCTKKLVKNCLHSSYTVQNTLHFDDFFFMKKIVKLCLRTNNTKVEIFFHFGDFVFPFQWCNVQFVRGFANHRANRPVFRSDTSRSVWQWQAGLYSDVSRPLVWVPRRNSISSKCKKFHFDFFLDKVDIIKHDLRINH